MTNKKKTRQKPPKTKKTIVDIANKANVSTATISRYFSDPELLKSSTREKIKQITEDEKFIPSLVSPKGDSKNSTKVAFLFNRLSFLSSFLGDFFEGLLVSAQIYQIDVLSYYSTIKDLNDEDDNRDRNRAIQNRVKGMVLTERRDKSFIDFCEANQMSLVYVVKKEDESSVELTKDSILIMLDKLTNENCLVAGTLAISLIDKKAKGKKTCKKYIVKDNNYKEVK